MLGRLLGKARQPAAALADGADLAEFLATRGAFVSQRATTEYCRARSGILWTKLMVEAAFLEKLEICRWIGFPAAAADIALIVDGRLRTGLGAAEGQRSLLVEAFSDAMHRYPAPADRPGGWDGEIADFALRLDLARMAAPRPAHELGVVAARRIFDSLPIHESLRSHDETMVRNHLRLAMVNVAQELDAAMDLAALGRAAARAAG